MAGRKLIEVIRDAEGKENAGPNCSFEYFPPRTRDGLLNLYKRFYRMGLQKPLFVDVTWGAGGSTSDLTLEIAKAAQNSFKLEMNMHLTCTNMEASKVTDALAFCKATGIRNICALRGDPPKGEAKWEAVEGGFACALDLIKFIRKEHGDHFGIQCAGYPEGHPVAITPVAEGQVLTASEKGRLAKADGQVQVCTDADFVKEIAYLKEKCDAGAEVIVTQLFYDVEAFFAFVKACRAAGIKAPILPGIMPIATYAGWQRMTNFCKTRIPDDLQKALDDVKDDAEAVKQVGLEYVTAMCKKILDSKLCPALHFYTLNVEAATFSIMKNLGYQLVDVDSVDPAEVAEADKVAAALAALPQNLP